MDQSTERTEIHMVKFYTTKELNPVNKFYNQQILVLNEKKHWKNWNQQHVDQFYTTKELNPVNKFYSHQNI